MSNTSDQQDAHVTGQHHNGLRGPFNSWILRLFEGYFDRRLSETKDELFADVDGVVVEIGPGNGSPTFVRYAPGTTVHAIEPNAAFHQRLREAADDHDVDLVLHPVGAERIPLPDDSVDTVVSSWVLCTVADQALVLEEIRRVLRPGGRLVFLEHVAAPEGGWVRRVQHLAHRPWRWLFEGCHTHRDTEAAIRAAGFSTVDARPVEVSTFFIPIRTQVAGTAHA